MTNKNLTALLEIEADLVSQLSKEPIFIQLEGIRHAIKAFQDGHSTNGRSVAPVTIAQVIIPKYDKENFTWREKIEWAVRQLGSASVSEIVKELTPLEGSYTKAWLDKRIGVTVSQLKKRGVLGIRKEGKKSKYFIK